MQALITKNIKTPYGEKSISVHAMDILDLDEPLDVMAVSAFSFSYYPTPKTMIYALNQKGIHVGELARNPEIDLRNLCGVWVSHELQNPGLPIKRIGCIERKPIGSNQKQWQEKEPRIVSSIQAYFSMLDILSLSGVKIETIGLPVVGGGIQKVDTELIKTPLLNECIQFLKRNESVKTIHIISYNQNQAFQFARALEDSYSFKRESKVDLTAKALMKENMAFISYSSKDSQFVKRLVEKLENHNVRAWYAPRNVDHGNYATSIVDAIMNATHFIVVISESSLKSQHVLNEIDLAFQELNRGIQFFPLRLDEEEMSGSFRYYLSRQQWFDLFRYPLEEGIDQFIGRVLNGIDY